MKKNIYLTLGILFLCFFKSTGVFSAAYEGNMISAEGAWCWFADPRSMHFENNSGTINSSYIGYIDVHGNIKATQHDFLTGKNNEVLIRSYFQADDHDSPTFLVLPDQRIMIFYSRHTDEACFYYRISKNPGDITSLGDEKKIITANNTTYPSPFIMSDDPTHIYLCWRGINWHPTIGRLTMPDASDNTQFDWGPYQMVQSTAARPYAKYSSNGKDKIYVTYTLGHPDNENPNWLYFNYIDVKTLQLKDITGNLLSTIASGVHNVSATSTYQTSYPNAVVDNPSLRDWVWQTTPDKDGNPVIALVQISADKLTHNYYYAKWTGSSWRKTFLANGGGKFHQTAGLELCYSGGMALDDSNPDIVYCSVPVAGANGTVYEIIKYTIGANGTVTSSTPITSDSKLNNVRPWILSNSGNSAYRLIWMHGNYYDWIVSTSQPKGYPTAVYGDFLLPADNINPDNGLIINEDFTGSVSGTAKTSGGVLIVDRNSYASWSNPGNEAFSVSFSPYIYEGAYSGDLIKAGNFTYGIKAGTLKPYIIIGDRTYNSTNLFGTSDVWQTQARGTGGVWYTPTKHKYLNLTITYAGNKLTVYRNGLIDQVVEQAGLTMGEVKIGGFVGWVEDCRIYNRALTQGEVKKLTETSITYTLNANLLKEAELSALNVPQNIYTDIVLPGTTTSGNAITWTTDNAAVVSNTGLVNLPLTPTSVNLSATISGASKIFNVTVHPRNIQNNKLLVYRFNPGDVYSGNGVKYIQDKSGKANDATVYGSALVNGTLDIRANTAAGFATNGYAMAPNGILNNLRSYTLIARVKPASLTGQPRIVDFGSASTNSILLRASAFTAGFKYNGGTTTLINSSTSLTVGQEALVAMSFDAKTKTTKIYHDKVQTASATTITYEPYQLTSIGENTRNYIGRTQWWDTSVASSNIDFNGTIDDFCLLDIALTTAEMDQILNDTVTEIKNILNRNIAVFPNPVKQFESFSIDLKDLSSMNNLKIELYNTTGQLVKSVSPESSMIQADAMSQKGVYLLRILSGNVVIRNEKLIVN